MNTPLWHVSLKVKSQDMRTEDRAALLRGPEYGYYIGIYSRHGMIAVTAQLPAVGGATAIAMVADNVRRILDVEPSDIYQSTARLVPSPQ